MSKYAVILEEIQKDCKDHTAPLDGLYLMGKCHAIQSIAINDDDITPTDYDIICSITQSIINEIIGRI